MVIELTLHSAICRVNDTEKQGTLAITTKPERKSKELLVISNQAIKRAQNKQAVCKIR